MTPSHHLTIQRSQFMQITFWVTPSTVTNYEERQWPKPARFFADGQSTINVALTAPSIEEAEEVLRADYKVPALTDRDWSYDGIMSCFDLTWRIEDITELAVDELGNLRPTD